MYINFRLSYINLHSFVLVYTSLHVALFDSSNSLRFYTEFLLQEQSGGTGSVLYIGQSAGLALQVPVRATQVHLRVLSLLDPPM